MFLCLKGRYRVFYFHWKLLWANYECKGKIYQAVNKCYTISVSFLPSGKTQWFSDSLVLFTAVLCLATGKKLPTAGSAARGGEGVVEETQVLVLCLSAWMKTSPYAWRGWGCEVPSPCSQTRCLLLALWVPPHGFRKFHIFELFEYLE